jgi:hypothetical protein
MLFGPPSPRRAVRYRRAKRSLSMRTKSPMPPLRRLSGMERILNDGLKADAGAAVTELRALAQSLARLTLTRRGVGQC